MRSMTVVQRYARRPDQILADIQAAFPGARISMLPDEQRARQRSHVRLSLGSLTIDRFETVGSEISTIAADRFHLGFVAQGKVDVRTRHGHVCMQPFRVGTTIPPGGPFTLGIGPRTLSYTVEFPTAELRHRAEGSKSVPVDHRAAAVDLRQGPGRACVRNIMGAFNELRTLDDEGLSRLAVVSFGEFLTNLVIAAAHANLRPGIPPAPRAISRITVQRARDYLEAHAHELITITGLATELGVSIRALQIGFQKNLHCSPMQLLLRCRLDLARARLLSPAPGDTVSSIALASGFVNLGKFAMRYRAAYGEVPSLTLGRTRSLP